MVWHKVARAGDVDAPGTADFEVGGHRYLLARVDAAQWYATDISCTHAWSDLTYGALVGTQLSCVSHGAIFDVTDGRVVMPPATRPLRVFPVRVDGEDVLVDIPEGDVPPDPDA